LSKPIDVLVLDNEDIVCERLENYLTKKGMVVETFTVSRQALERLKEKHFDVVVTDLKMDAPTGMEVLRTVQSVSADTEVIIITGYATIETSREAEVVGAFSFIAKPFQMKEMHKLVQKAAQKSRKAR